MINYPAGGVLRTEPKLMLINLFRIFDISAYTVIPVWAVVVLTV